MAENFRNITGTFDILPDRYTSDGTAVEGTPAWRWVEDSIRAVMDRFRFMEIRTPVLEPTELIARGIGRSTDIVSKEMFAFERGDTGYVLRPEVTAPVMRAYLQHHLAQKGGVQRLYYIGPCFRAERPQKGRFRQFHQFGVEIIGSESAYADAETMAVMVEIYRTLGLSNYRLRINSLGDTESRQQYRAALRTYFEPFIGDLSQASRNRLDTNPLRILDTKIAQERALLAEAPVLSDYIDDAGRAHFEEVKTRLSDLDIPFEFDPFLVRGLDYYNRTAFELESPNLGAQSALAGGGRYDLLSIEVGGKEAVPAVGFAAGVERLFLALQGEGVEIPTGGKADYFIVALGDAARAWAFRQAIQWRRQGVRVAFDLKGRSMKAQMREANRQQSVRVVIVGDDELDSGSVVVREMETGNQETVPIDMLMKFQS